MNYLKEINAFYDWLETNSLSTSSIVLWHALMHINNKAGWAEEFAVAISALCVKTGLAPRTISQARNELKQKGRIDWRKRRGNQSALYKIIPFLSASNASNYADKYTDNNLSALYADSYADNHADNYTDSYADNHAILNKLNKTKLNNVVGVVNAHAREDDFSKIVNFYNNNFGMITVHISDCIQDWLKDMEGELIIRAMEIAIKNNKRKWAYVEGILRQWQSLNINTLELLEAYKIERDQEKQYQGPKQHKEFKQQKSSGNIFFDIAKEEGFM